MIESEYDNDATLEILARAAVSQAESGALAAGWLGEDR